MKTITKKTLVKLLAASFCVTAAAGTALIIDAVRNVGDDSPFKGIYGGNFAAFAEGDETSTAQVGNLIMKKMISQDGKYILLAASISDTTAYDGLGYYITENGVSTSTSGNVYYTGIQVKTGEDSSKTFSMQDIFGAEYSYEGAGMIVYEAAYTSNAEYEIAPYLITSSGDRVTGSIGYIEGSNSYVLKNGSFETGDLTGWTLSESGLGAVTDASRYWVGDEENAEGYVFDKSGNYLFSAYANENEAATGTLTSSVFTVGGSGWITFKLGAAKNYNQVYVEVVESGSDEVLARYGNTQWQEKTDDVKSGCTLIKYKADLSDFKGKQVYIRITDNGITDYGLFFADEFITYYESEPDSGATAENILYRGTVNKVGYQVVNGGFETGDLTGWTLSNADAPIGYVSSQNYYWSNADNPYNKDDSYLFTGVEDAGVSPSLEGNTGTLTSSLFKVGGSGWITFKAAGGNDSIYISVTDAAGTELMRFRQSTATGTMTLYKADLSSLMNQEVRIVIYDNATTNWGCIAVDSFITYYETADSVPAEANETFNLKADKTELSGLVDRYSQITEQGDYTDESYTTFTTALTDAQNLLAAEEATADVISEQILALQTAYDNLAVRVPEVNGEAQTTLNLYINKSATLDATDYFDTKELNSITYSVTASGVEAVLGDDRKTVTVMAGAEACEATVTVNVLYDDEIKASAVISVTVTAQAVPSAINENVSYEKDVYYQTDKTGFTIDLSQNVNNAGELDLTYSVSVDGGESQTVEGAEYFFTYGSYEADTATTVTLTVTVHYTANGEEGSFDYTITLSLTDSTANFTFTTEGIYPADGGFEDFN